jgi:malate synthase
LLVKTCHRRGAHAIGGMSAFIPSKDEAVNQKAYEQVRADKERESSQGYDGTWVAHPKLVAVAKEIFDKKLQDKPHQKEILRDDLQVKAEYLLAIDSIERVITEKGFRTNVNVALLYIESWLRGVGAAALYNLMEDAATAEISRAQLWQWLHKSITLDDGQKVTPQFFQEILKEEYVKVKELLSTVNADEKHVEQAYYILDELVMSEKFEDFLTIKAYQYLD